MSGPLLSAADAFGTPLYVYDLDAVHRRIDTLTALFGTRFGISYAIKANPNPALLASIAPRLSTFDASSWREVERALAAGMPAARITFSGPAKRAVEIRNAVESDVGELVVENVDEARQAGAIAVATGRRQSVLLRINPARVPRGFGASMAGTPSQFGVDEEDMGPALDAIMETQGLELIGFHIYSGTNCRDPEAIAANFEIFAGIFRAAQAHAGIRPKRLVFGSGFGIPYLPGETELDHDSLPALVNPIIDGLLGEPAFSDARCNLEMGRWLVGLAGWLLTGVVAGKRSRGSDIRACDAGFNAHLAACGMMGSVIRRNWVFENLSNPEGTPGVWTLVGPLCTTIDRLALDVELPEVRVGDILSVAASGAYGLTASPTRFISHPEPREAVIKGGALRDATESTASASHVREAAE
jgi:diaminopimelate decarboxylase